MRSARQWPIQQLFARSVTSFGPVGVGSLRYFSSLKIMGPHQIGLQAYFFYAWHRAVPTSARGPTTDFYSTSFASRSTRMATSLPEPWSSAEAGHSYVGVLSSSTGLYDNFVAVAGGSKQGALPRAFVRHFAFRV